MMKMNCKNLICHSLVFFLFQLQMSHPTEVHAKKWRIGVIIPGTSKQNEWGLRSGHWSQAAVFTLDKFSKFWYPFRLCDNSYKLFS